MDSHNDTALCYRRVKEGTEMSHKSTFDVRHISKGKLLLGSNPILRNVRWFVKVDGVVTDAEITGRSHQ